MSKWQEGALKFHKDCVELSSDSLVEFARKCLMPVLERSFLQVEKPTQHDIDMVKHIGFSAQPPEIKASLSL